MVSGYDGNIRSQTWRSSPDSQTRSYTYSYNNTSRLTGAAYVGAANKDYSISHLSYDANGGLQSLRRLAPVSATASTLVDNLTYTYATYSN